MEMTGERALPVERAAAWRALNDVQLLQGARNKALTPLRSRPTPIGAFSSETRFTESMSTRRTRITAWSAGTRMVVPPIASRYEMPLACNLPVMAPASSAAGPSRNSPTRWKPFSIICGRITRRLPPP